MKGLFLAAGLLVVLTSFSQTSDISWYKMLKGKIDKYPVTLHLHKADHGYVGYYYYDTQQKPIYIAGDDTTKKGKIQLVSYADPQEAEYFLFTINGSQASGTWKKTEKSSAVNFSADEAPAPLAFTYVFSQGSAKLRPKWKESPEATYYAASVWPVGKTAPDEFLKSEIRKALGIKNAKEEIGILILKDKNEYLKTYVAGNKDVKDADLKESVTGYMQDQTTNLMIAHQSDKMITLANTFYSYTGGAHGMYGTSYLTINLTTNKVLSLNDVLNQKGQQMLSSLLEKNFRKERKMKPNDSLTEFLFEDKIQPNENFFVTGKGITFNFVPYEIASFADGEIMIYIPFTELDAYLKPSFKALLK
jgi:hypothetical protein